VLPYPISVYRDAQTSVPLQPGMANLPADFKAAERLVKRELALFEIIESVHVESPNKIEFMTLERWSGPLAASGHTFTVKTRQDLGPAALARFLDIVALPVSRCIPAAICFLSRVIVSSFQRNPDT